MLMQLITQLQQQQQQQQQKESSQKMKARLFRTLTPQSETINNLTNASQNPNQSLKKNNSNGNTRFESSGNFQSAPMI